MPRKKGRAKKILLGQNIESKEEEQVPAELLAPEIEPVVPEPKAPEPVKLSEIPENVEPMKFDEDYVEKAAPRIALAEKPPTGFEPEAETEEESKRGLGELTFAELRFYRRTGILPK